MVPDSSPRASKGVLVLAWRLLSHCLAHLLWCFCFWGGGRAPPPTPGVALEASKEWFDSFEVLMLFVMPRPVWLFPHANWP
jgi:hypothetical protein